MKLRDWFVARGLKFVFYRATRLLGRYGIASSSAIKRIESCMTTLARFNCLPTFAVPAVILQRYPDFFRDLQDTGVEIFVHGYQHINLNALPVNEAKDQLVRAADTFKRSGIDFHGFRCPYVGCSDELIDTIPVGLFDYSSNRTICYKEILDLNGCNKGVEFDVLTKFYEAKPESTSVCRPWIRSNLVEIPVCVPDDLQLCDGLNLNGKDLTWMWKRILHRTHARGELFTLLFHLELASFCDESLVSLLEEARGLRPAVWIVRLREICDWWQEKAAFDVKVSETVDGLQIYFDCTPRATILTRGIYPGEGGRTWDKGYQRVLAKSLDVPADPRPFVGLAENVPEDVVNFLREQGYIVETGEKATRCGIYLDAAVLSDLPSEVDLVNYIEDATSPIVRYWPWPDGSRSAMCVTGDLDAITLLDYASRLFIS
jgi:peptidoglycan/xylan/chitin deacetylase (PgdA/CDA1 family)